MKTKGYNTFKVGDQIITDEMEETPVGSIVFGNISSDYILLKTSKGWWSNLGVGGFQPFVAPSISKKVAYIPEQKEVDTLDFTFIELKEGVQVRWEETHNLPVGTMLKSSCERCGMPADEYGSLYFVTKLGLACKVNHKYCLRAWTELLSSYSSLATIIYLPESK